MRAGAFNASNTVVNMPSMSGSGISGNYDISVQEVVELRLLTFDNFKNPIEDSRDWSKLEMKVPKLGA
jgi:hypothetical protein